MVGVCVLGKSHIRREGLSEGVVERWVFQIRKAGLGGKEWRDWLFGQGMSGDGGGGRPGLTVLQQRGSESFLFPCMRKTMFRHNHDRAFEDGSGGGGGGGSGGGGLGPTGSGGAEEVARCLSDIYDVAGGSGSGGAVVVRPHLQPFDTSAAATTALSTPTSKSPGALFLF